MVGRPNEITNDSDTIPLPPDCYDALLSLFKKHRLGDRDGDRTSRAEFELEYQRELGRLRALHSSEKFSPRAMGDGLTTGMWPGGPYQVLPIATIDTT
jgi:hypothetical protein